MPRWSLSLALALALGCVTEPDYTGRACSTDEPCPGAFTCVAGLCQPDGLQPASDAGPRDAAPPADSGPRDGGALDTGPRPDAAVASLEQLDVTPASASLAAGRSQALVAEGRFSDGTMRDVTAIAVWASGDESIVRVTRPGRVEAVAEGTTLVEVELGGLVARAAINVTAPVVEQVATWNKHNLVAYSDGRGFAWGWNVNGQVDDSGAEFVPTPVQVNLTNIKQVRAAGAHSVAILDDGTVWAWGNDQGGQLGRGMLGGPSNPTPMAVSNPEGTGPLTGMLDVRCGYDFCLALTPNRTVLAWGANSFGSLGLGLMGNPPAARPTAIPGLSDVEAIAAGTYHGIALKRDGSVWTWGYNEYGQLGNDDLGVHQGAPVRVLDIGGLGFLADVEAIDAGWGHTVARVRNRTLRVWGWNGAGQLGPTRPATQPTPVVLLDDSGVAPLADVAAFSAGFAFVLAQTRDGHLWSWGSNLGGQLGAGSDVEVTRPDPAPVLAATGGAPFLGITALMAGSDHAIALTEDGVWTWGANDHGELGNGQQGMGLRALTPAVVPGL